VGCDDRPLHALPATRMPTATKIQRKIFFRFIISLLSLRRYS
jgi:hypothetical protein